MSFMTQDCQAWISSVDCDEPEKKIISLGDHIA